MLLFNAEVINYRLKKLDSYIEKRQAIARKYDDRLKILLFKITMW